MRLETVITFLIGLNVSTGVLIPSEIHGRYTCDSYQAVKLKVGTPGRSMKLILDYTTHRLLTKIPLSVFSASSKSTLAGSSDVVRIQGRKYRVLVGQDTGQSAALGCPDCAGVFGIGPMSKLWLYAQDATFTAGAIALEEGIQSYERVRMAHNLGRFRCLPMVETLCAAKATVYGRPNITVIFGANSPKTLVPVDMFDEYTTGLSISANPSVHEWGNIHFRFHTDNGNDNRWNLRAECIVSESRKGGLDLLLAGSGSENTVVLSRATMDCMMFKRFFFEGRGQIVQWTINRKASTYTLVALVVLALLYSYWTLDPAGAWTFQSKNEYLRVVVEGLTIIMAITSLAVPTTWHALRGTPEMGAYVLFTIFLLIMWQLLGALMRQLNGKDLFGEAAVNHAISNVDIGRAYRDVSLPISEHRTIMHAHVHNVLLGVAHPRIWVVQSLVRHTIIVLSIFLFTIDTRVESFGSMGPAGAALLLIYGILYYGIVGLILRDTKLKMTFTWAMFWVFAIYLFLSTVIIMDMFVLKPFVMRFASVSAEFSLFLRAGLYAVVAIVAIRVAIKRVQIEEILRERALVSLLKTT